MYVSILLKILSKKEKYVFSVKDFVISETDSDLFISDPWYGDLKGSMSYMYEIYRRIQFSVIPCYLRNHCYLRNPTNNIFSNFRMFTGCIAIFSLFFMLIFITSCHNINPSFSYSLHLWRKTN